MLPVALEGRGPLVQRTNRLGVGPIELLATLAAHVDEAYIPQNAQVLRHGRLRHAELTLDLAHRLL